MFYVQESPLNEMVEEQNALGGIAKSIYHLSGHHG